MEPRTKYILGGLGLDMDVGPDFLREWRDRFGPESFEAY